MCSSQWINCEVLNCIVIKIALIKDMRKTLLIKYNQDINITSKLGLMWNLDYNIKH